ncbi:Phage tail sheath subtilisin-like domain-containing protein [Sulfidibacter corallicola]|uniref:Phage tail sheath subtilisin-like domain-containing protein n=1 Tax=Sulfidibacter corallicola TaxID=2818388 RepID=A0A8A4TW62_SULCO|nr:phage tail sheath C-terminal domain-containing protein [Sulfidibacter corallicola]QTD54196.1 phage tail sheath subtilisin-like domain-containing protein [Sulfidibacter corallicola]
MTTYLSPGIYTKETDFSFYVKQISTSSAAMVGVAERVPINSPSLVTSWEQFANRYGGYIQAGYLAYAARAFFDNGGRTLYVNRVAHLTDPMDRQSLTAVSASHTLLDRRGVTASLETGQAGTDRITWQAREAGTSGNVLSVVLDASGIDTPLSVEVAGNVIRVHLATDSAGTATSTANEIVAAIDTDSEASALVTLRSEDTGFVTPVTETPLAGGTNGQATLEVTAINEGTWGNDLTVYTVDSTRQPTDRFNLIVRYQNRIVEVHRDLSMDESSRDHVEAVVNEASEFIRVRDLGNGSGYPDDRPGIGEFVLSGGDDGLAGLNDQDFIGDAAAHSGIRAFDEIDALNLVAVPGVTTAPVIQAGITYAENRKDLLFIADAPLHLEPLEVIQWRKGQGGYTHTAFNSTYGAVYYPWLQISDPLTSKKKLIPPSGAVCGCIARSDQKTNVWSAPAGTERGRIFNVLNVGYRVSRGDMDALYPEGINSIVANPDTGVVIWGQRTLTLQPSALDRINVRRLMMYMEEAIGESSRFVIFEPNHPQTWRALLRLLNPFLLDIQQNGGLYEFRVQCDEETNTPAVIDRNEMRARVFVKPTKTAEFVELNFVLITTGASFDEIFAETNRR